MSNNDKYLHITKNNWTSEYLEFITATNKSVQEQEKQGNGIALITMWSFPSKEEKNNWFKMIAQSLVAIPNQHHPVRIIRLYVRDTKIDTLILLNTPEKMVADYLKESGKSAHDCVSLKTTA